MKIQILMIILTALVAFPNSSNAKEDIDYSRCLDPWHGFNMNYSMLPNGKLYIENQKDIISYSNKDGIESVMVKDGYYTVGTKNADGSGGGTIGQLKERYSIRTENGKAVYQKSENLGYEASMGDGSGGGTLPQSFQKNFKYNGNHCYVDSITNSVIDPTSGKWKNKVVYDKTTCDKIFDTIKNLNSEKENECVSLFRGVKKIYSSNLAIKNTDAISQNPDSVEILANCRTYRQIYPVVANNGNKNGPMSESIEDTKKANAE